MERRERRLQGYDVDAMTIANLLRDGERIFGYTIYVAKRVASLAKAQQTLVTRQAKDLIGPYLVARIQGIAPDHETHRRRIHGLLTVYAFCNCQCLLEQSLFRINNRSTGVVYNRPRLTTKKFVVVPSKTVESASLYSDSKQPRRAASTLPITAGR